MPFLDVKAVDTKAGGAQYLFFLASGTPSWCPDCREALPAIESVFGGPDAPTLHVIQVGTRDQWKSADNQWRGPPLHVKETPCIVKLVDVSVSAWVLCSPAESSRLNDTLGTVQGGQQAGGPGVQVGCAATRADCSNLTRAMYAPTSIDE